MAQPQLGTAPSRPADAMTVGIFTGAVMPFAGSSLVVPAGWLLCYGQAVSRITYANLFTTLNPTLGNPIITIATPAVVTLTGHGLVTGDPVIFSTTGALPTGITAGTTYYVIYIDANTFSIATSFANAVSGVTIATSGSQSGTHSLVYSPHGYGDGNTTFNVPDMRGRAVAGKDNMGGTAASRLTQGIQATNAVYSQSSVYPGTTAANYAGMNDGSASGATVKQAATTSAAGSYIRADLGSSQYIDSVVLGWDYLTNIPGGFGPQYLDSFLLQGSNNGTAWTTVMTLPGYGQTGSTNGLVRLPVAQTWRYLQVTPPGTNYVAATEFQLWVGGSPFGAAGATLGAAGGEQVHTLSYGEMPSHHHSSFLNGFISASGLAGGSNFNGQYQAIYAGGGGTHNVVQPTIVLNYLIKT